MLRTLMAASVIAISAGMASAVTVDSFDTAADTGMIQGLSGANGSTAPGDIGGIGTNRVISATILDTAMNLNGQVEAESNSINNERFSFSATDLARGSTTIKYSGIGGLDLSGFLEFIEVVNDAAFDLTVAITDTLSNTQSQTFSIAASNTMVDLSFDLSGLAAVAGDADILELTLESQAIGGDISFGAIETTPVPLPAAGLLLLAGVGGIAAMRRRAA